IAVTGVNDAPVATNDSATTAEDTAVTIAVLRSEEDTSEHQPPRDGVCRPLHGTATSHPDGTITYTPAANYDGADSFTYTISDGHGGTATATSTEEHTAELESRRAIVCRVATEEKSTKAITLSATDVEGSP